MRAFPYLVALWNVTLSYGLFGSEAIQRLVHIQAT